MTRRDYFILFALGFAVVLLAASLQPVPGYMDADYYLMGGLQLARGEGFTEWVLWHYLDDPAGLPHPSHGYWMPLASILAALGIKLLPSGGFAAGRVIFLGLAGLLAPVTAALSYALHPRRNTAWLAGLLAIFPAFYLLPFLTSIDTFATYMLLGAGFLWITDRESRIENRESGILDSRFSILGFIAGLMHLARADGLLWLGLAILLIFHEARNTQYPIPNTIPRIASCVLGYALVMFPWFIRNNAVFGSVLAPGGARALWLTEYNELFSYPPSLLTFARWWGTGLGEIVRARLWALGQNLQSALAVQGSIFLAPLVVAGLWELRRERRVQVGALAWALTLAVMTLAFPFAGARGGFFHSGAAVQPLFWAVAPVGLDVVLRWAGRRRGWRVKQARRVFGAGMVGLAILLTAALGYQRAAGLKLASVGMQQNVGYAAVELALQDSVGASPSDVVLVNNPPGYFLASGRPAIVIPNGAPDVLLAAARRYAARYVLLEPDHVAGLEALYQQPQDANGLLYLETVGGTHIFEVMP